MNACKAIEKALAATLRQHANLGEATWLRCSQSQREDWDVRGAVAARHFPQVYLVASPERTESEGTTLATPVSIDICTLADDDPDCGTRAEMYEQVRTVIDAIYDVGYGSTEAVKIYNTFVAEFAKNLPKAHYGGMLMPDGMPPFEVDGVQVISFGVEFAWARV